ncbi:hypothetical protein [Geodermatophilus chilensis]|uniref:hypothetical protein n=1 Tax=Geodermatophilus chilensis TaxID=2035835 RepID=UPI000C25E12E|nr:hypothetical protein [Geodermatophilus chilensis]
MNPWSALAPFFAAVKRAAAPPAEVTAFALVTHPPRLRVWRSWDPWAEDWGCWIWEVHSADLFTCHASGSAGTHGEALAVGLAALEQELARGRMRS